MHLRLWLFPLFFIILHQFAEVQSRHGGSASGGRGGSSSRSRSGSSSRGSLSHGGSSRSHSSNHRSHSGNSGRGGSVFSSSSSNSRSGSWNGNGNGHYSSRHGSSHGSSGGFGSGFGTQHGSGSSSSRGGGIFGSSGAGTSSSYKKSGLGSMLSGSKVKTALAGAASAYMAHRAGRKMIRHSSSPMIYGGRSYYWGPTYFIPISNSHMCSMLITTTDTDFGNVFFNDGSRPRQIVWSCPNSMICCGLECCPRPQTGVLAWVKSWFG